MSRHGLAGGRRLVSGGDRQLRFSHGQPPRPRGQLVAPEHGGRLPASTYQTQGGLVVGGRCGPEVTVPGGGRFQWAPVGSHTLPVQWGWDRSHAATQLQTHTHTCNVCYTTAHRKSL